jgi:hypothetical protein
MHTYMLYNVHMQHGWLSNYYFICNDADGLPELNDYKGPG